MLALWFREPPPPQTQTPDPSLEPLFPGDAMGQPELVGLGGVFQDWALTLAHFSLQPGGSGRQRQEPEPRGSVPLAGAVPPSQGRSLAVPGESISTAAYSGRPFAIVRRSRFIVPTDRRRGVVGRQTDRCTVNLRSIIECQFCAGRESKDGAARACGLAARMRLFSLACENPNKNPCSP